VEQVKDAFEPDYIILQCGLDSLAEDPCATFNWSLASLGQCVDRVINHWKGRKLLLGGGKSPRVHNIRLLTLTQVGTTTLTPPADGHT
jgi:acetoin utilization deacetylase AcuC-like enzyme